MNFEEAQRLANFRKRKQSEASSNLSQKKIEITEFLKTHSIFKDMLETKQKTYEDCVKFIYLNEIIPKIRGTTSMEYLSGFKDGINYFGKAYKEYFKVLDDYNNLIERDK